MIPQDKSAAVSRGLQEAFGTTTIDEISRMTRGLSSDLVFRIAVKGSPYLLRIMTRISEQMDPHRIYACMIAASDAGLTPHVHYASTDDGVSITDFVEASPLPLSEASQLLPRTLRALHSLPPFPREFNFVTAHKGFIWRFRDAALMPRQEVDEAFEHYSRICETYPRLDTDMVSSHMDLKPDNILYDGRSIWLVDWQAAFLNDRYFDLSVVANYLVSTESDEYTLLETYFNHSPDEYERARFFLMRQALHMLSSAVFLMLGSGGKPVGEIPNPPSFEDFYGKVWAGEVNFADKEQQIHSGLVHWKRLLHNIRQPRCAESLQIVSSRNAESTRKLLPSAP
jgi:aminoglycoside phosphotransferase (APT) family kinase protein